MSKLAFGAKPSVLRCSRCGKFVDWEDARLQVVCGCRTHLDLPPVLVRQAEARDQEGVQALFTRDFGRLRLVAFGQDLHLESLPVLVAELEADLAGALAYRDAGDEFHVVALATDPMWQRSGVGGHLVVEAERMAQALGRPRVAVSMTNDNLPSLYFYQRRGYRIDVVLPGEVVRHVGGEPVTGFAGIPIRDELRLVKVF